MSGATGDFWPSAPRESALTRHVRRPVTVMFSDTVELIIQLGDWDLGLGHRWENKRGLLFLEAAP